ncbi:mechanosensitive ion channel family protein [Vulcaniibacterium tengchongense]|uniref:Small-conductance mechanosensitive channel n=1 Tax=Vulcaniibacterium tengchongense TaxID=1273429 RepID=A0A3N4W9J3_9GAMM|nr:mechanosensitive ion channel family protein [Vulcaniibacterium tengchongense]RPE81924.1 mechanosensitive ion channel-like protein [Vulcaniibacterium tengchongense]
MKERLPPWIQDWLGIIVPVGQVLLILFAAWLLQSVARRLIQRIGVRYSLPPELSVGVRRVLAFVIYVAAALLALERLGVSGSVLWAAFTGFATVAAVAFFAAWSVLSNIFCTVLIFITRPFRLYDHIELLENGEKPGLKGQVLDINLIYTTLQEQHADEPGTLLQIPNNLFFQRSLRRWRNGRPQVDDEATTGS